MAATSSTDANRIPRGVWVLGFVSLLMDISSEMIHSLLPVFLLVGLGTSALAIGVIEGVAESTALIVKVFSGTISDYLGRRKIPAVLGYGLGAVSKPFFAVATTAGMVFTARFVDRIGKGIRGAPRDALIADLAPSEARGAAYGLRQALDTVGAFVGPLLAMGLMLLWSNDFRAVFWVAVIPGMLAVILLMIGVREPKRAPRERPTNPIHWREIRRLGPAYRWVAVVGAAFSLARFSEAFLVLRAQQAGLPLAGVPLVLIWMNLVYAVSAYPFGKLSDDGNHARLLMLGLAVLVAADCVLAMSDAWPALALGIALWGLHLGMTQGLLARMVADTAPDDLRGTAFGVFNLLCGLALLAASALAGLLWDRLGPSAPFTAGALIGLVVLAVVALRARQERVVE
jgi:MFS family permease